MKDLEILKQDQPDLAEYLERWRTNNQRSYDLNDATEQANFYEATLDIVRHMATVSQSGALSLEVCNTGATGLKITVTPNDAS